MNRTFAVAPPGAERNPNTGLRVTGNRSAQASEDIGRFLPAAVALEHGAMVWFCVQTCDPSKRDEDKLCLEGDRRSIC